MELNKEQRWKVGAGTTVVLIVLVPLWFELRIDGQPFWNAFLALLLIGLLVAAVVLQRHLMRNIDKVGEARFDTRNK